MLGILGKISPGCKWLQLPLHNNLKVLQLIKLSDIYFEHMFATILPPFSSVKTFTECTFCKLKRLTQFITKTSCQGK